jgi:hypothetical protein
LRFLVWKSNNKERQRKTNSYLLAHMNETCHKFLVTLVLYLLLHVVCFNWYQGKYFKLKETKVLRVECSVFDKIRGSTSCWKIYKTYSGEDLTHCFTEQGPYYLETVALAKAKETEQEPTFVLWSIVGKPDCSVASYTKTRIIQFLGLLFCIVLALLFG